MRWLADADALNRNYRSYLRLVEPSDAAFICSLRSDAELNAHLNASAADIEMQRQWIERYRERESAGTEFYFVICCDGDDWGVVRMYDFRVEPRSFCWGSWIIRPPRPKGLVTFSALMIYELGFDGLGFEQSHFDVRKGNTSVIAFHQRSGAREIGEDQDNRYFVFDREKWSGFRERSSNQIAEHRVQRQTRD